MAFKVFGETEKKPPDVFFRLVPGDIEGSVRLVAVNASGERIKAGNIMKITQDGRLYRCSSVNPDIGLKLDDDGCVLVAE